MLESPETVLKRNLGPLLCEFSSVLLGTAEVEEGLRQTLMAGGSRHAPGGRWSGGGRPWRGVAPPGVRAPGGEWCILLERHQAFLLVQTLVALVLPSPGVAMRITQL